MAFIRWQGVQLGEGGIALKGSAALVKSEYVKPGPGQKHHCRQVLIEKLGKVLWQSDDRRTGIFDSPTRGLVEYRADDNTFDSVTLEDERLNGLDRRRVKTVRHHAFGDTHWLLTFLCRSGHARLWAKTFQDRNLLARLHVQVVHAILAEAARKP